MRIRDLGMLPYREAWRVQEEVHAAVVAGEAPATVLVVEHPPVITFGRRSEVSASHLRASAEVLRERGVEVVESDRGGDITFHGPGQIVVYPIVRLAEFCLSVGGYVRRLEAGAIATCASIGIHAGIDPEAIGVWVRESGRLSKVCAVGVRVKGGATLHGLALNHSTDLSFFELIVPCGISDKSVTSVRKLLGDASPGCEAVKDRLVQDVCAAIAAEEAPELKAI